VNTVELLLHPLRLRIVQALLGDQVLTPAELSQKLDVTPASLYRHINLLTSAGMLEVASERPIRGTVERSYRLNLAATRITPEELASMTAEDHHRAFIAYIAGAIADFDKYLSTGDIDLVRDGVGYTTAGLWLDDQEFLEFAKELAGVFGKRIGNKPREGRRLRTVRMINLPGGD
jgi:DNA-binding transcriptional ArsR family regulator